MVHMERLGIKLQGKSLDLCFVKKMLGAAETVADLQVAQVAQRCGAYVRSKVVHVDVLSVKSVSVC